MEKKQSKGEMVRGMFNDIAPTYDRLNHILSFDIDKLWRKRVVAIVERLGAKYIMDMATGTGDLAIALATKIDGSTIYGADFSSEMLAVAKQKIEKLGLAERISLTECNAENIPLADEAVDAATVAFGVRNFEDLDKGLREMHRVLDDNGKLVILELSEPEWFPMKQLYALYSKVVIPTLGKLLSKDRSAYTYLPQSIKAFPQGEVMKDIILKAGFSEANFKRLTLGICTLYTATK